MADYRLHNRLHVAMQVFDQKDYDICTEDGRQVASADDPVRAQLIASAPELLDTLQACACVLEFYKNNSAATWTPEFERRLTAARAAIKAAKGE